MIRGGLNGGGFSAGRAGMPSIGVGGELEAAATVVDVDLQKGNRFVAFEHARDQVASINASAAFHNSFANHSLLCVLAAQCTSGKYLGASA